MKTPPTKKVRVPRTRGGGTYTESQFWGMIRAALRSRSRFWPPISSCKKQARRPCAAKGRQKWEYLCSNCHSYFMEKEIVVHHKYPIGELRAASDLPLFVERLFCEQDGLTVVCKGCHSEIHKKT